MQMCSRVVRHRAGFTLIEMLIVIGIIAMLAALTLPAILRSGIEPFDPVYVEPAPLGVAITCYKDKQGYYPPYRIEDTNYFNQYGVNRPRWQWLTSDFLGRPAQNPDALLAAGTSDPTYTNVPLDLEILLCPSQTAGDPTSIRSGSYGYNFQYLGNSRNVVDGDPTTPFLNFPVRNVNDPARTIAFGDSRGGGIPHGAHSMTLDPPHERKRPLGSANVNSPSPMTQPGFDPYGPDETGTDIAIYFSPTEARHNARANVVFLDGHCEGLTLEALGYVVSGGVAQPQLPGQGLPWGDNKFFTGWGRDETSPFFGQP